jgi:hypothetical protein
MIWEVVMEFCIIGLLVLLLGICLCILMLVLPDGGSIPPAPITQIEDEIDAVRFEAEQELQKRSEEYLTHVIEQTYRRKS